MFEVPAPTPATVTFVVEPAALIAPLRVSMTRFGLNGVPAPSELSTRTAFSRFHAALSVPVPRLIHIAPSPALTVSK